MKGFIETIKNIFSIEELRKKLIYTFLLIFIYRIGTYIVLPGVDPNALGDLAKSGGSGLLGLLDMFVGGSFNRACSYLRWQYLIFKNYKKKVRAVEEK